MKKINHILLYILVFSVCSPAKLCAGIEPFRMAVDESLPIQVDYNISDIAVGNPEIAGIRVLRRNEFLINGKSQGVTSITIWDPSGNIRDSFNVEVIRSLIPADLIQIKAQIVEVSSSDRQQLGVQWTDQMVLSEGVSLSRSLSDLVSGDTHLKQPLPGIVELGTVGRLSRIKAEINFMLEHGYGRILANPHLVARSGGEAHFWVGGEVPFLVPGGENQAATIDWKEYGVELVIKPTGDPRREIIDVDITIKANNIDYENSVLISGYSVPGIATREVTTSLQVKSGETIIISGLKQLVETKGTKGIPVLSRIPVLGHLFKHETVDVRNTEVTAFLTPEFFGR